MPRLPQPGQLQLLKLLGFDQVLIERAEGMYYLDQNGRAILDFFGGFGSLRFGHNHPRILAARRKFSEEKRHEICMAFMSQYAAALSHNLAQIAPGDLDIVFLCSRGSEANEAALKLAERAAGPRSARRSPTPTTSFHGKTRARAVGHGLGVLPERLPAARRTGGGCRSASGRARRRLHVATLRSASFIARDGAGRRRHRPAARRATGKACASCATTTASLWLADEVQCGYGRTGRFFAFEHDGRRARHRDARQVARRRQDGDGRVYRARADLHEGVRHRPKTALIHGPATFSGMGEGCVTAIEALQRALRRGADRQLRRAGRVPARPAPDAAGASTRS